MAVYTLLSAAEISAIVKRYDLGDLRDHRGISAGVENSNYALTTARGRFILTIFEQRVVPENLPFYFDFMAHLARGGLPVPRAISTPSGEVVIAVHDKPAALIEFLPGADVTSPHRENCAALGHVLGKLHNISQSLMGLQPPRNAFGLPFWLETSAAYAEQAEQILPGLGAQLVQEAAFLQKSWRDDLPMGIIHGDLFPDNVFFQQDYICGVIDFYFSCYDILAYDLAICINAWCFDQNQNFLPDHAAYLLRAYHHIKPLSAAEYDCLPILLRGASLRFLLTRLMDRFSSDKKGQVDHKDPLVYWRKLSFHQKQKSWSDYGLS